MQERPILFSGEMVRAILDGRKTQTRRVIKLKTGDTFDEHALKGAIQEWRPMYDEVARKVVGKTAALIRCPYGQPGDRLWVRETFADEGCRQDRDDCYYRADGESDLQGGGWTPSIHMPRWASRITLEIVSVRVERLREISEADAKAEGCWYGKGGGEVDHAVLPENHFPTLWESINGPGSWGANPWVWVVEFKRVEPGRAAA